MATISLSPTLSPGVQIHLTRRGRLVVTALALLMILALGMGTAGRVAAGSTAQAPALESVVVQPGQSLWRFAATSMPGTDTREAVVRIRELNGLAGSVIRPGQVLLIPAS